MNSSARAASQEKKTESQVRYLGFRHLADRRLFEYKRLGEGKTAEYFMVAADVNLMSRHGVILQEAAALCGKALAAALAAGRHGHSATRPYVLTTEDVQTYMTPHVPAPARKGSRRPPAPEQTQS